MKWTLDRYLPYPGNRKPNSRFGRELKVLRGNGYQKAGHYFLDAYRFAFTRTEANPNDFLKMWGSGARHKFSLKKNKLRGKADQARIVFSKFAPLVIAFAMLASTR